MSAEYGSVIRLTSVYKSAKDAREAHAKMKEPSTIRQVGDMFFLITEEGAKDILREAQERHVSAFI